jgi:hypothetical protein
MAFLDESIAFNGILPDAGRGDEGVFDDRSERDMHDALAGLSLFWRP